MAETGKPDDVSLQDWYSVRVFALLAEQDSRVAYARRQESIYIAKLAAEHASALQEMLAQQKVPMELEPEGIQDLLYTAIGTLETAVSQVGPMFVDELCKEPDGPAFKLGWVHSEKVQGGYVIHPTPLGTEAWQGILNIRGQM